ncbi:Scramblase-domain-containing protein [Amniculicola lignicola CBS 123094]|uniref:Scramblase-domain-containing protein n=1 Tax=Amniculicola lignicola CBS 123094 TaxID=1392246 RepID=A0A6A5VZ55_9PLEO|nr:Scramblase-domain-containing protein [Amniculicola lignicola CBS 123094]
MLSAARWTLRLPQPSIRAFATKNTPQGPRGAIRRPPPPPRLPQRTIKPARSSPPINEPPRSTPPPSNAPSNPTPETAVSKVEAVSTALSQTPDAENSLITPVYMPEDPHAVLKSTHPAMRLLDNSAIVIQRQLEMMNVLMGFEQANRYVIMDPHGNHIGYLAERDHGIGSAVTRQMFKTHRSFTTHIFDKEEREILRFHRPFSWINSRIRVYDAAGDGSAYTSSGELQGTSAASTIGQSGAQVSSLNVGDMRIIGAAEQEWAPLRRKYNLFLARDLDAAAAEGTPQLASGDLPLSNSKALAVPTQEDKREPGLLQFANVNEPFLSWDFPLKSKDDQLIGSVNRNFVGFARELFTDTGVYALRMDAAGLTSEPAHLISKTAADGKETITRETGMTLDQRAVMLATAVSIDFDYFSRHSGAGGMFPIPIWFPFWGAGAGAEAGGAVAAGEAGAIGAAAGETGIASEAAAAARGLGAGEGAIAGAGTMAGYEAMRGMRGGGDDGQSPQANDPYGAPQGGGQAGSGDDVWGQSGDPWEQGGGDDPWKGGSGGGDGEGGGFWDFFE